MPGLATPRRVRERLRRAGFVDVRVQWAWPLPQRSTPLFWLPADAPAAVAQFFWARLIASGLRAVARRFDVGWSMKALFAGWIIAMGVARGRLAAHLAALFLFRSRRWGARARSG